MDLLDAPHRESLCSAERDAQFIARDLAVKQHRNTTFCQRSSGSSNGALGFTSSIAGMKAGKIFAFATCSYA
jgi:hypothetical protein